MLTAEERKQEAEGLLPALLNEFQAEIFSAWQSAQTVDDREKLHARQIALTLFRSKLDAATKRER